MKVALNFLKSISFVKSAFEFIRCLYSSIKKINDLHNVISAMIIK